jgi:serine protease Do
MALESLLKQGRIIRGYLGIETTAPRTGPFGGSVDNGVVVSAVMPNSPAAEAHIQRGDIIQKFDGHDIHSIAELQRLVSQVDLNKKVPVEVTRSGKSVTVSAQIKEQPANYQLAQALPPGAPGQQLPPNNLPNDDQDQNQDQDQDQSGDQAQDGGPLAAIEVHALTPQLAQSLGVPPSVHGVVVARVDGGRGGTELRAGDVIEAVNQEPVSSVEEYESILQRLDPSQPQVLSVCRRRTRSFVVIKPR